MADAIPSSAADAPYSGTFACASAETEAAFPGLAIDHGEADKTRKHAHLIAKHRPGDRFMPVIHDEHGALGPDGRALARKQNLRTRGLARPRRLTLTLCVGWALRPHAAYARSGTPKCSACPPYKGPGRA